MSELLIPEYQPNFPHEDVSEVNAVLFEQLLLDPEYVLNAHEMAEAQVTAFKMGHSTIRSLGYALYKTSVEQRAFSYGATIYEALSTTVRPIEQCFAEHMHISQTVTTLMALRDNPGSAIMGVLDEAERFADETPVVAKLMETAALFQPDLDARLIMWGAALERGIDRDTRDMAA